MLTDSVTVTEPWEETDRRRIARVALIHERDRGRCSLRCAFASPWRWYPGDYAGLSHRLVDGMLHLAPYLPCPM